METYIHRIQPLLPQHVAPQEHALTWLQAAAERALAQNPQKMRRALRLYERFGSFPGIRQRRSVVGDYAHLEWDRMELFREWPRRNGTNAPWFTPPLEKRMEVFQRAAIDMIEAAFVEDRTPPKNIIEVSCTGYGSPSPGQTLLARRNWGDETRLLRIGHMGCYAALPALEAARPILCSTPDDARHVTLFLVELCTLHLQPDAEDIDKIVTNVLFGDGAVRLDLSHEKRKGALKLLGYRERLVPGTLDEMSWHLADSAFGMTLGKEVPALIGRIIADEVAKLLRPHGYTLADVGRFAIHPGGPRIIEAVQNALALDDKATRHSHSVLADHGNMSSTTLPHIWERMLGDATVGNELIVSMGFGPGLTVALSLMEKIPA